MHLLLGARHLVLLRLLDAHVRFAVAAGDRWPAALASARELQPMYDLVYPHVRSPRQPLPAFPPYHCAQSCNRLSCHAHLFAIYTKIALDNQYTKNPSSLLCYHGPCSSALA